MDEMTQKIHKQYMQKEINKMQKTAKNLEEMINKKDPLKDEDLIEELENLHSKTIEDIKNKRKKLKKYYNKSVKFDNS